MRNRRLLLEDGLNTCYCDESGTVGNQQEWDSLRGERSWVGLRSSHLP